ncbi:MAG: hypothetical protein A3G52_00345 [Candidatus Taylorbacteria bacterium RIFCSPLOWO2_12_FULL_43_20]|uniref:Uncharacterized protein n=1 Tax=Candidatus Taylorbacteria bacterium RIFCSPLOWO2_12_FULL_43_20 TaxID=1802332 RepID=A0A1G2P1J2_9BACT|nr:MAG: hypothetical protein A2825_01740 [Candidatus Taylorbacteria bacterium RIFCSPHIGHO2_01_FULL_43_120]OHA23086.1 MAG: hypothetical protein A3B98_03465 [Candidatus Taylorbacteria bacterium RIFCSPHIGHO2_02_FULL_43_55]OHA28933.1 MAG: hypothetical protein A3E92_04665 [Candidatus Taylorbacteria bacterium RIFCSPHIGHO2_12_FULL_42_34]OHA37766.1 MAG: hypothetical protein A3H58_01285 [Candidatus Taylorbacteria bacterium RIFCSPLOWO2_02_FULL_43_22b]OHA42190.1 MAG: hypothetical protein A3G52_00345 [Cand
MNGESEFGKEIGLIHQLIMLARKHGANERFWKALVQPHSKELLCSVIDKVQTYTETGLWVGVSNKEMGYVQFLCFSQNSWVEEEEAHDRLIGLGKPASDAWINALYAQWAAKWHTKVHEQCHCQYPIVAIGGHSKASDKPGWTLAIVLDGDGRAKLQRHEIERIPGSKEKGFPPGTLFAVISRKSPWTGELQV